jgi:hypothetical protein
LDFFPQNLSSISDEHGEHFHNDIKESGELHMPSDYCWSIIRDVLEINYKWKSLAKEN